MPPVNEASALITVQLAEDGWNSRDPEHVALAYTGNIIWRNCAEFASGCIAIAALLAREWTRDLDYRVVRELRACTGTHIAVSFAYEYRDSDNWFRAHGNESGELATDDRMGRRVASINEHPIQSAARRLRWPLGHRPDDHPGPRKLES
jgi:nuclear transport factor 2 (NTF2) superfamily protein